MIASLSGGFIKSEKGEFMGEKYFGVMLDVSRNAVMKVETVKRFVDYISAFGYNMLQLYTEDTYEVNNEPYFGHLRGGYKKNEIKEIDAYCKSKVVELIPCIQTLAHLRTIFRWFEYQGVNDCGDILLIDDPRTYKLIENMFATLAECYSTRKVHIGMDEAHMVGRGKYMDLHGVTNRYELLKKHLQKVVDIAKKYGFKPIMWSDMFFRMANNGEYYGRNIKLPKEAIDGIPDVDLVYWDYYHKKKADYSAMLSAHEKFNKNIWFAGGAWCWYGFAPGNRYTLKNMKPAMQACKQAGVKNIFITMWGDNGKECSYFSTLPALFYLKRYYDGVTDRKQIAAEFKDITGESFERMMNMDAPNYVGGNKEGGFRSPCKYMLYNDPFFGWLDTQVKEGVDKEYKRYAKRFAIYARQSEEFAYLYDFLSKLCKVLSYKYDLGVRVREAYQSQNKEKLTSIVIDFKNTEKAVKSFYKAFRELWHKENKPHGFEVHDIRLGGLIMRLKHCRERIEEYLRNEQDSLPELEEVLLDLWGNGLQYSKETPCFPDWGMIVTTNQLTGF